MDMEMELCLCDTEWQKLTEDTLWEIRSEAFQMNSLNSAFDLDQFQLLVCNTYELFLPYYLNLDTPLPRKYLQVIFTVLDFAHLDYADQTQSIARRIAQALCDRLNGPAVRRGWLVPGEPPVCTRVDLRPDFLPVECPDGDVVELSLDSFDLTKLREGRDRWWRQNDG